MAVQIPLKRKYTRGGKGRFHGGENYARPKKRHKVGYEKHIAQHGVPPVIHLVVDGLTGSGVFVRVD